MGKYIEVGQIVNTHGLRGEVKVNPWTDAPEVFEAFDEVYLADGTEYKIENVRYQKNCARLKLSGVDVIEKAERLKNKILMAKREIFDALPEDTYLVADIKGLVVKDEDVVYGTVDDVITTGSNDVYIVKAEGRKDILIPAIKDVILEINVKDGYILVNMPKGLIDYDFSHTYAFSRNVFRSFALKHFGQSRKERYNKF